MFFWKLKVNPFELYAFGNSAYLKYYDFILSWVLFSDWRELIVKQACQCICLHQESQSLWFDLSTTSILTPEQC